MGFKYEEDRVFIVAPKGECFITANGTKCGADLEIEALLGSWQLYHAFCDNGKFYVHNNYVKMELTAEQLDMYFKEPFIGVQED